MAGRFALIDKDARALARVLRRRGDFAVTRTADPAEIAAFLAARDAEDVVLIHMTQAALPRDPLRQCLSERLLVVYDAPAPGLKPASGQAFITGISTHSLVEDLTEASLDRNGTLHARELFLQVRNRSSPDARPTVQSRLSRPFEVVRSSGPRLRPDPLPAVAAIVLVGSLALPWLYGSSGFTLAFGAGTAWPSRAAAIVALVLALLAAVSSLRDRVPWLLALSAVGAVGAWIGFAGRWRLSELDAGLLLAFAGAAVVLVPAVRRTLSRPQRSPAPLRVDTIAWFAGAFLLSEVYIRYWPSVIAAILTALLVAGFATAIGAFRPQGDGARYLVYGCMGALMAAYNALDHGWATTFVAASAMIVGAVFALSRLVGR